jgi:hypothetical protein
MMLMKRPFSQESKRFLISLGVGIVVSGLALKGIAQTAFVLSSQWWFPGQDEPLLPSKFYPNASGLSEVINVDGQIITDGHPFFEPIGTNGRGCVSCHQPANSMSISVSSIQQRWQESAGSDPLFAMIDGANCPDLDPQDAASHSLLLEKGLFRIGLPWPPNDDYGNPIDPEFTIEVVNDPTGCNTSPEYGLESDEPKVSVYRRPRPVANLKYVATSGNFFNIKTGMPLALDLESGRRSGMNMMSDARASSLRSQMREAAATHLQLERALSEQEMQLIEAFERQVYTAQSVDNIAGSLSSDGSSAGPQSLIDGRVALGDDFQTPAFGYFDAWLDNENFSTSSHEKQAFMESVKRGNDIYMTRTFWISDSTHINSIGLGNPLKRTCATCHNMQNTGMDLAPGYVDLGTTNLPHANNMPDLPLFKLTCDVSAPSHPYLGREIYTYDPGRALISGECADIGAITMQQMRGLAGRAPYFSNGSAQSLREIIDFYDRRYNIGYTEQERQDLVNFLSVL